MIIKPRDYSNSVMPSSDFDTIYNTFIEYFKGNITYDTINDHIKKLVNDNNINIVSADENYNLLLKILSPNDTTSKKIEVAKLLIIEGININYKNNALLWYLHNIQNDLRTDIDFEFYTMLINSNTNLEAVYNHKNIIDYIKLYDRIEDPCKWYKVLYLLGCSIEFFKNDTYNYYKMLFTYVLNEFETLDINIQLETLNSMLKETEQKITYNEEQVHNNKIQIESLLKMNENLNIKNEDLMTIKNELPQKIKKIEDKKRDEELTDLSNKLSMNDLLQLINKKIHN